MQNPDDAIVFVCLCERLLGNVAEIESYPDTVTSYIFSLHAEYRFEINR